MVALALFAATALAGAPASARPQTRSCGYLSWGIGWKLRATPDLSCPQARRVFKDCFAGSNRPRSCREGFRCRQRTDRVTGIATETCIRGRREVVGKSNP
jgi:ribosomal protein L34